MEDHSNQARGHKATLSNPRVSKEAKQHSRQVLRDEFGGEDAKPMHDYKEEHGSDKHLGHVAGGLKATMHNPRVSEEAKHSAEERLEHLK